VKRSPGLGVALALVLAAGAPRASAQGQAQAEDEETEVLLGDARGAIAHKEYAQAATLLDQALQVSPRRIDLYVLRASVYGVQDQHDRAIALLERARQLAPDNDNVLIALGIELVQVGKAGDGVPLLEKIAARQPRRYDAQAVLGHHYLTHQQWPKAVAALDAYFKYRPEGIGGEDRLRLDWADAHLRTGDAKTARHLYEEVLGKRKTSEAARLGVAWSAAATDCREAMPILDGLADLENKYAEVSLVRGRCALLLGRLDEALAATDRYRKARPAIGDGWALLGDVQTEKRNYTAAETAYGKALELAPKDRLYAFKLARSERLLGKPQQAAKLLQGGAPPGYEDDWTIEYGEALFALGQSQALVDHIGKWSEAHPERATAQFLYGAGMIGTGDTAGAVAHLDKAHSGGEPRAAKPLIDALNALAVSTLAAKPPDLARAKQLLGKADEIGDDVVTGRTGGASRRAGAAGDGATRILKKATDKAPNDAIALHLYARALVAGKKSDDARAVFARAIKAYGKDPRAATAGSDLAQSELAAGRGEQAVDALEAAFASAPDADSKTRLGKLVVTAARAAATDAMRTGRFGVAVRVLKDAQKIAPESNDIACDLALAATGNGQRDAALEQLHRLEASKATCPFVAPADELAVPILIAWNEGGSPRKVLASLQRLDRIRGKARGAAEPLARIAAREIALHGAQDAYVSGNLRQAQSFLQSARAYDRTSPEIVHDLAVIQLASGDVDGAIGELERVREDVPEAFVNLGVAYDRKHVPEKAIEYWKRAVSLGVHFGPLKEWLDVKNRFWGEGGAP
jgi:tetratricopeptide (TPR) repeat protein